MFCETRAGREVGMSPDRDRTIYRRCPRLASTAHNREMEKLSKYSEAIGDTLQQQI